MTVQSIKEQKQNESVRQYAKAIAKAIDRAGLRTKPYSRVLITGPVVRDGAGYYFSIWGTTLRNVTVFVREDSVKRRTVRIAAVFNCPRREIPVSKLLASAEEIAGFLWPDYEEVVYPEAVGMIR